MFRRIRNSRGPDNALHRIGNSSASGAEQFDLPRGVRVILVSPLPPPVGGLSVWTQEYLRASQSSPFSVTLVNTSPGGSQVNTKSRVRLHRVAQMVASIRDLASGAKEADVAHICTTWFWSLLREGAFARVCRWRSVVPVLHVHASTEVATSVRRLSGRKRRVLQRWLRPFAAVLVLTEELRLVLAEALPDHRVTVVPNWVDTESFRPPGPGEVDEGRTLGVLRVLFVGRLSVDKGFVELADAVCETDGIELTSIGDRPAKASESDQLAVDDALARLSTSGRHRNVPLVRREDIAEVFRSADVFVLPSWSEGMPISLLEAMATGLPGVITPVGAMGDLATSSVDEPFGLVVPVQQAAALTDALMVLRDDPVMRGRLGERGRRLVQEQFSADVVMSTLDAVYSSLVQEAANAKR